jgi:hypothetical protein
MLVPEQTLRRSKRFQELLNVWIAPPAPMLAHDREQLSCFCRGHVPIACVITDQTWGGNDSRSSECRMDEGEVRARELVSQEPINIARVRENDSGGFALVKPVCGKRIRGV